MGYFLLGLLPLGDSQCTEELLGLSMCLAEGPGGTLFERHLLGDTALESWVRERPLYQCRVSYGSCLATAVFGHCKWNLCLELQVCMCFGGRLPNFAARPVTAHIESLISWLSPLPPAKAAA